MKETHILILIISISILTALGNKTAANDSKSSDNNALTFSQNNSIKENNKSSTDINDNDEKTIERKEVPMKVLTDSQIPSNLLNRIKRIRESKGYITSKDSDYFYIAILGGQKPSSGYKIEVLDVYSENNNLIINIDQISPPPKTNVLTVLTYPYTVIRVDKNYTNITVTDTFGNEFKPIVFGEVS